MGKHSKPESEADKQAELAALRAKLEKEGKVKPIEPDQTERK